MNNPKPLAPPTLLALEHPSCLRKRPYRSISQAEERLAAYRKRPHLKAPLRLHIYMCPHCGAWHIGHKKKEKKKEKKEEK